MKRLQRALLASCLGLLAVPAMAWEWNYGPATMDDGYRRVHPVPACGPFANNGYIAIGTQDIAGPNPDVYVTYTDANGNSALGWEATYDVEGLGLPDQGRAIVSVPGKGYVFLSNSLNVVWQPALTFIDCKGKVVWSQLYPDSIAGQNLWGNDLIRTQSGDPLWGTAPGDYAVAGWWWNGTDDDAFLMRTDANGVLLWNVAHNNQNLNEAFNGLTEALPAPAGQAADLVAVGRLTTTAGDLQGLVARVSSNNGLIGALPQCMQHHGNAGSSEIYNAVTRLQTFFAGQFAIVGLTRGPNWGLDAWVTRTNSCVITAQARFGNPGGQVTNEIGNDIIELQAAKPGAPAGSLVIAGEHTRPGGLPVKGARLTLNPAQNLIAGQQWLYGINNPNFESFYSLAEDPNPPWAVPVGYVFSGRTSSPFAPPADPQDMFLVHDNPAVVGLCEQQWFPVKTPTNWPWLDLQPWQKVPAKDVPAPAPMWYQNTGIQTCNPS